MSGRWGTPAPPHKADVEQMLFNDIWGAKLKDDPYAFTLYVFPWGQKGTPLWDREPRAWQREALWRLRDHYLGNVDRMGRGGQPTILKESFVTGHGPGKSALVSWMTWWMESTRPGATVIITANKEEQLRTRTFAELGKWKGLALNSHWFKLEGLSMGPAAWYEHHLRDQLRIDQGYFYAKGQLWREEDPDSFTGAHNPYGLMLLHDEASGLPYSIYNVCRGFFTELTPNRFWFLFGNGWRADGPFFDLHTRRDADWRLHSIDSRTVEGVDVAHLQGICDKKGEDSYDARTQVRGMFPKQGEDRFFSREDAELAATRELVKDDDAPLILGIDVARKGGDQTVFFWRQGRDARSRPLQAFRGLLTTEVTARAARVIEENDPEAVCVDGGGVGGGVVDQLTKLGFRVHDVQSGAGAEESSRYKNKRTELAAKVRDWMAGGCLPNDDELLAEITGVKFEYDAQNRVYLQPKEEAKKEGIPSPDRLDGLAMTFAVDPPGRALKARRQRLRLERAIHGRRGFDPFTGRRCR